MEKEDIRYIEQTLEFIATTLLRANSSNFEDVKEKMGKAHTLLSIFISYICKVERAQENGRR